MFNICAQYVLKIRSWAFSTTDSCFSVGQRYTLNCNGSTESKRTLKIRTFCSGLTFEVTLSFIFSCRRGVQTTDEICHEPQMRTALRITLVCCNSGYAEDCTRLSDASSRSYIRLIAIWNKGGHVVALFLEHTITWVGWVVGGTTVQLTWRDRGLHLDVCWWSLCFDVRGGGGGVFWLCVGGQGRGISRLFLQERPGGVERGLHAPGTSGAVCLHIAGGCS